MGNEEIDGIILDLGLTSYDESIDYEFEKGLNLLRELTRKKINIPILINSSTRIDLANIMKRHTNVKGQMFFENDYTTLRSFISFLKGEEQ